MAEGIEISKAKQDGDVLIVSDVKQKYQFTSRKILLTAKASAKVLGYSAEHFCRLKSEGDAPKPTKHRNRDHYTIESLKEWGKKHGINVADIKLDTVAKTV